MDMEQNKILAAILTAGIIGMLAWFVSHKLYEPEMLAENAYKVEVADTAPAAGGAVPAGPEPIEALLATADPAKGEQVSKICASCHSFNKADGHRIGPNLAGVFGRTPGTAEGYAYSDGMKAKGGTWNAASLNEFLWNPKKAVAGTKMTFAGLKKPEERAALIKWLQGK